MAELEVLENATDNMIRGFKEIYTESKDAGHAIDKMQEPSHDNEKLIRGIEKYADEIIAELELLKQDIEKWKDETKSA